MQWLHDRSLTLTMMGLFSLFLVGQAVTGWLDHNQELASHQQTVIAFGAYFSTGHFWEALFENWESEFLQMAAFVMLSSTLYQTGSPESRRPGVKELVDVDPRDFADQPRVPWPVRRGGVVLWLYERSLGWTFLVLFGLSWVGHAAGGWFEHQQDQHAHGEMAATFAGYLASPRFWFESFQNWQSEFLSVAAMVWLAVYLRHRGSPESKPVHAPHSETGR